MAEKTYPPLPKDRFKMWVDDESAMQLRAYKYSGVDLSVIYRYVLTPMNEFLVQFIPMWVAPNLITLFGLVVCVACHIVTYEHSPTFDAPMPPWLAAYVGFTLFAYQTIDNLDGKQARRTGNGSALGLLFDHGVDALNCTITTLTFSTVMQVGPTWKVAAFWFITFCPFVFATWDEYYTHKLTLSEMNGPTDGVLFSVAFCLMEAFKPGFWLQTTAYTMPVFEGTIFAPYQMHYWPIWLAGFGVFVTVLSNIVRVLRSEAGAADGPASIASKVWPFAQLSLLALVWAWYSPSNIYRNHLRLFMFAIGILFAELICKLMLAHLSKANFRVGRLSLAPLVLVVVNAVFPRLTSGAATTLIPQISEYDSLRGLFVLACISWVCFVFPVVWEVTTVLNIRCFVITPKPPAPATAATATTATTDAKPKAA